METLRLLVYSRARCAKGADDKMHGSFYVCIAIVLVAVAKRGQCCGLKHFVSFRLVSSRLVSFRLGLVSLLRIGNNGQLQDTCA